MDSREIIDKLIKKKLKSRDFDPTLDFKFIGIDSIDIVDIVFTVEDKLKIKFEEEDLNAMKCLNDLYRVCEEKVNG